MEGAGFLELGLDPFRTWMSEAIFVCGQPLGCMHGIMQRRHGKMQTKRATKRLLQHPPSSRIFNTCTDLIMLTIVR